MPHDMASLPSLAEARGVPLPVGQWLELVDQTCAVGGDCVERLIIGHDSQDWAA